MSNAELDRRRFLKQAGAVAWATPLILTLAANRAGAQAVSCLPDGTPCGQTIGSGCLGGGGIPCCSGACLPGAMTTDTCLCGPPI